MSELERLACRSCGQILDATPCPECGADAAVRIGPESDAHPLARSIPTLAVIAFSMATLMFVERTAMWFIGAVTLTAYDVARIDAWVEPVGRSLVDLGMLSVAIAFLLDRRLTTGRRTVVLVATVPALVISLAFAIVRLFSAWSLWGSGPDVPRELLELLWGSTGIMTMLRAIAIALLGVGLVFARRASPGRRGSRSMMVGLVLLVLASMLQSIVMIRFLRDLLGPTPEQVAVLISLKNLGTMFGSAAMLVGAIRWRAQHSSLLRSVGFDPSDRRS